MGAVLHKTGNKGDPSARLFMKAAIQSGRRGATQYTLLADSIKV
jgi:hypothetical protein